MNKNSMKSSPEATTRRTQADSSGKSHLFASATNIFRVRGWFCIVALYTTGSFSALSSIGNSFGEQLALELPLARGLELEDGCLFV